MTELYGGFDEDYPYVFDEPRYEEEEGLGLEEGEYEEGEYEEEEFKEWEYNEDEDDNYQEEEEEPLQAGYKDLQRVGGGLIAGKRGRFLLTPTDRAINEARAVLESGNFVNLERSIKEKTVEIITGVESLELRNIDVLVPAVLYKVLHGTKLTPKIFSDFISKYIGSAEPTDLLRYIRMLLKIQS